LQNFLAKPIPVSRTLGGVATCFIALDPKNESARPSRMPHANIDKIPSYARPGAQRLVAHRANLVLDENLELEVGLAFCRTSTSNRPLALYSSQRAGTEEGDQPGM
jgi:hypothetical protein